MRPLRYKDLTAYGQVLYLICVLVIFSYVLFDVLDLDGSNFAKIFNSSHRTFIGAFVPAEAEFDFAAKRDSLMTLSAIFVLAALVVTCTGLRLTRGPVSALIRTRAHGSLLAFARNSLPDSIPDH